jgi:hypothetical protein
MFGNYVNHIYNIELYIKDTTHTARSGSYLDHFLTIDSEGGLRAHLYESRDYLNSSIKIFLFICNNIPSAHVYGVYISQL